MCCYVGEVDVPSGNLEFSPPQLDIKGKGQFPEGDFDSGNLI